MKRIVKYLAVLGMLVGVGGVLLAAPAGAVDVLPDVCDDPATAADSAICKSAGGGGETLEQFLNRIVDVLFFVIGALTVIYIVVAGIMYLTSGGSDEQVKKAKHTLTYAVVGLAVAILSYAIAKFVIGVLNP